MNLDAIGTWLGWLLTAGYAALVAVEALRFFRTGLAGAEQPAVPAQSVRRVPWPKVLGGVLVAFLLSRLLIALCCAAMFRIENQTFDGFLPALAEKLTPWDADHYLGIIERMYVTEGDARLHIVFLPFFPAVCRALCWLTGASALAMAELVSNGALIAGGFAMYRLVELDGDAIVARRAVLLLKFCPLTYFFSIPYTESTFMLVTLLAVLCARERRFGRALLFGAMASCTRVVGLAVAIPIYWEWLRADADAAAAKGAPNTPGAMARRAALCAVKVLPVSAGLLIYLNVNYRLYGNPTQFMIFQRENWYQTFGSMANTFRYCLCNALGYDDMLYRFGVWWPQVLLLVAVPVLLWRRRKRERPGDTAYLLATHYVNFAPTWLLSGARYLSGTYALYPLLARIPRTRKGFAALLAAECALMIGMTVVGLWHAKVY